MKSLGERGGLMIQGVIHSAGSVAMQRARGKAFLSIAQSRGASRMVDLAQSGSARIMLPQLPGPRPEAVLLNTSGGLTSGDVLEYHLAIGEGASLTATTQTAERAYLSKSGPARLSVRAEVATGGELDWLPQETILFQGADLTRETRIDLGKGSRCLMVETVVLGRRAMGEVVTHARLRDRRQVFIQGRPVHFEAPDLTPGALAEAGAPAMLGPAIAYASLALVGPGAETAADALHPILVPEGVTAAASGWNGRTLLRAVATDLWPLKLYLAQVIVQLSRRPLPRVWQMQGVAA
jgi:urease accessory protein